MKTVAARAVGAPRGMATALATSTLVLQDYTLFDDKQLTDRLRLVDEGANSLTFSKAVKKESENDDLPELRRRMMHTMLAAAPKYFTDKDEFYDVRMVDFVSYDPDKDEDLSKFRLDDPCASRVVKEVKGSISESRLVTFLIERGLCNLKSLVEYIGYLPHQFAEEALLKALTADKLCYEKNGSYLPQLDLSTIFIRADLRVFIRTFPLQTPQPSADDAWNELCRQLEAVLEPSPPKRTLELLQRRLPHRASETAPAKVLSEVERLWYGRQNARYWVQNSLRFR